MALYFKNQLVRAVVIFFVFGRVKVVVGLLFWLGQVINVVMVMFDGEVY